ncbi:MAG: DNA primase [Patescibacteria group bacterium]
MDEVARIREKTDIVALLSEYIPLKKAGRNFKTPCPFHNEKTPSFVVSPERQIWHCFGCGKGGDAFTFLMDYENLEFVEALRILAKRTGIELGESDFVKKGASKKEKIYKINQQASDFYHYILTKHPSGKRALKYLTENRKIDERLIETFKIGYSPSTGSALSKYLMEKKKHQSQDLIDAGISYPRSGRIADFFRDRLMFPIYDHRDNIVAFSGRILNDQIKESKYVNTRDTLAYHKGSMFFGLNMAKNAIKKNDQAIIVEGEFDVISCYSEGIENTVAIKGTALTEDQVSLLSRFTGKVTLCLDRDEAGFEAVKRSLAFIEKKGLTTTFLDLERYKDPDEAIKADPVFFKKQLKNDIGIYDYLISEFSKKFDPQSAMGKKKIADNILPFLSLVENEIVKEHYLKKLSHELDTSLENLKTELEKSAKKETIGKTILPQKKDRRDRREVLEEYLLALLIQIEDRASQVKKVSEILVEYKFTIISYQKIFENLKNFSLSEKPAEFDWLIKSLPKEIIPIFDTVFLLPLPKFENEKKYLEEILKVAEEMKVLYIKNRIKDIAAALNKKEKDGKEFSVLQEELSTLVSSMQELNSASKT